MTLHWRGLLEDAHNHLQSHHAREAFLAAFQALEACYQQHLACPAGAKPEDRFAVICRGLLDGNRIPKGDFDLAVHLGKARNVVSHSFGFEPSQSEAEKTLRLVHRLCARFSVRVSDVMVQPVRTARPEDPLGLYLRVIREDGISQFPVVNDKGHVIGTFDELVIFTHLDSGDGKLPEGATVESLMRPEPLPEVKSDAELRDAWRQLRELRAAALLILQDRSPVGIVTKYDLLHNQEL